MAFFKHLLLGDSQSAGRKRLSPGGTKSPVGKSGNPSLYDGAVIRVGERGLVVEVGVDRLSMDGWVEDVGE